MRMKTFCYLATLSLLLFSGGLYAAPDLTAGEQDALPGDAISIPIDWVNDGSVVAQQFDVTFDASALNISNVSAGVAGAGHTLDWQVVSTGRLRVVFSTPVLNTIPSANLVNMDITVASNAVVGEYPLVIENPLFSNDQALPVMPTSIVPGKVTVISAIQPPTVPAVPIPTLGWWALILMAGLFVGLGWLAIRRGFGSTMMAIFIGCILFTSTLARAAAIPGDANDDGVVDAADIPIIVAQILERQTAPGDPDCNQNASVDVLDTICVANTVPATNSPPVLASIADRQLLVGETLALTASASDVDLPGDTLTWSLDQAPSGMSIVASNGALGWTPTNAQLGTHSVVVRVGDSDGEFDTTGFSVEVTDIPQVNSPPVLAGIADRQVLEGVTMTLTASASDADLPADTLTWSLDQAPSGMSIAALSGVITWTPTNVQLGNHSIVVRVTDADGEFDTTGFGVEVTNVITNAAPDLVPPGNRVIETGGNFQTQLFATDPDAGDVLTFSLVSGPTGLTIDANGNLDWNPTTADLGTNTVTASVSDVAGLNDDETFTIKVQQARGPVSTNRPPSIQAPANQSIVFGGPIAVSATANDPDAGDVLTFSLTLAPSGMSIDSTSGAISWTPQQANVGAHDVTVKVEDNNGALAFGSFIVTVLDINHAPVAVDDVYEARLGVPLNIAVPGVLANDSDPSGDPISAVLKSDAGKGQLALNADGSFDYLLEPTDLTPPKVAAPVELELWCDNTRNPGSLGSPAAVDSKFQGNATLAVGDVDNDGDVEIVGLTNIVHAGRQSVWIMNAEDCTDQFHTGDNITDAGGFKSDSHPGLHDIDGDGDLEIIGVRGNYPVADPNKPGAWDNEHLLAIHHDGTLAWSGDGGSETSTLFSTYNSNKTYLDQGPTFVDLEGDGTTEIVMASSIGTSVRVQSLVVVYNAADGSIKWEYLSPIEQSGANDEKMPYVVDLDLDGTMEVIIHNSVLDHTGALEFVLPMDINTPQKKGHLTLGIGDFDDDPYPELVGRNNHNYYMFEHDGTLVWEFEQRNNSTNQISVADFDGDGELEFADVGYISFSPAIVGIQVFNADGTVLWDHGAADEVDFQLPGGGMEARNNITAFDANGDGAMDIVYRNDTSTIQTLFIFDGRDGTVLDSVPARNYNGYDQRFTTVADINGDGHAELINSHTGGIEGQTEIWTGSAANPLPFAPAYRHQWNFQSAYVNDDLTIPEHPIPHWLQPGNNGYHAIPPEPSVELELWCDNADRRPGSPSVVDSDYQGNSTLAVGDVDNDGDLEVVGVWYIDNAGRGSAWMMNSQDCTDQFHTGANISDAGGFDTDGHLGLHDIDGDGDLEIIGPRSHYPATDPDSPNAFDAEHLIATHHDGTLVWPGDGGSGTSTIFAAGNSHNNYDDQGPTFVDLEGDGTTEIVMASSIGSGTAVQSFVVVYNAIDGSIKWEYLSPVLQSGQNDPRMPYVVDLDLDGTMEVIVHNSVIDHTGVLEFVLPSLQSTTSGVGHLTLGIGNFDDDPYPELVGRDLFNYYMFEHDGTLVWEFEKRNRMTNQVAVADFDGDGDLEFADVGNITYSGGGGGIVGIQVFNADGSLLWDHGDDYEVSLQINRQMAQKNNITAFDANRDGAMDIVYRNDTSDIKSLFIFDGRDGSVLTSVPADNYVGYNNRFTTVADINGDGHAELLNSYTGGPGQTEIWTGTAAKPLPNAPAYRHQWNFQPAYVNDDLSIPASPVPHWLQPGMNGYHMIPPEPDPLIGTTDSFTYVANDGDLDSNVATVTLDILPAGNPPEFLSEPDELTTLGFPYIYEPIVVDPDLGDSVSFTLAAGPNGMSIDSSTGAISWSPQTSGSYNVSILALDTIGFATSQAWVLVVGDPVVVPDVIGQTEAAAGNALSAENLLVGDTRTATHPTIAAGSVSVQTPIAGSVAEFGSEVDLVISSGPGPEDTDGDNDGFTPNDGDCNDGDSSIFPGASDAVGDGIDQDCDGIDGNLPLVEILVLPEVSTILTNQTVELKAIGIFDDGTSQNLTGIATWSDGPQFSSATAGTFTVTAMKGGINGNASITVVDRVAADVLPPVAVISSPTDDSTVTEPVDVMGTATDANFMKYELSYGLVDSDSFVHILESTSQVNNGVLGQFDPSLLVNGLYTLRLTVFDSGGNQTVTENTVLSEGDMKVGNFSLSFTDLQVPMSGIPITVTRNYDSRETQVRDFGAGWSLGVDSLRLRVSGTLGEGWRVDKAGLNFSLVPTGNHIVSLTLANGQVEVFDLVVSPQASPIVPFPASTITASYQARPGTMGQLTSLENNVLTIIAPQPGEVELVDDISLSTYNPDRFRYTQIDGTEIIINRSNGVESIQEPGGNRLTISENGISHSSGKSIIFNRDDLGRIQSIVDPNGVTQSYVYDANGDLRSHSDREGWVTLYRYNLAHGLIEIDDPLGNRTIRNEYDDDGRLTASTDADGHRIEYDHNIAGRQEVVTDLRGGSTVYQYDEQGHVISQTDSIGGVSTFTYDAAGNILTTTDPLGGITSQTYDAQNNVLSKTDPLGNVKAYTYNTVGNQLTSTDALGQVTRFEYNSTGNQLLKQTDASGSATTYTYDSNGNVMSVTDPAGGVSLRSYDAFGNRLSETDPLGNESTFKYDANGNRTHMTRIRMTSAGPEVVEMKFSYNANGFQTERIMPNGSVFSVEYDAVGRKSAVINQSGNRTEFTYDGAGNEIGETLPDGTVKALTHDANGNITSKVGFNGETTNYTYDSLDQLKTVVYPDGSSLTNTYDSNGEIISNTDALGNVTAFEFDASGRNTKVIDALNNETTYIFDANNNVVSQTDANSNTTTYVYDTLNRLVRTNFADGTFSLISYDALGNKTMVTDQAGLTSSYTYDFMSNLTSVTDPMGQIIRYDYDEMGNRIRQQDANGNVTHWEFNAAGLVVRKTYPEGMTESWTYDSSGNKISHVDPNGATTLFTYDVHNRLILKKFADLTTEAYTYTPSGQKETSTNAVGTTTWTYDTLDRVSRVDRPNGNALIYTYDAMSNRTSVTSTSGTTTTTFDALNRPATVTDADGATTVHGYDQAGNLVSVNYPNGSETTYHYDSLNRLIKVESRRSDNSLISQYSYVLGLAGNRLQVSESGGRVVNYTYDDLYRLTKEEIIDPVAGNETIVYAYDAHGNRVSKTDFNGTLNYIYDANDRLMNDGIHEYSYDANGNTLRKSSISGTTLYSYDFENQLVALPSDAVVYEYDPDGIRLSQTVNGASTHFVVDTNRDLPQVLEEQTSTGATIVSYVYGDDLISQDRLGVDSYYVYDGQMSTRNLLDSQENITDSYTYDAFGVLLNSTGSTENNYLYTGEQFDPNAGFYYLRARYYSPEIGRFTVADSFPPDVFDPGTLHRYVYVKNNPVDLIDPSGQFFTQISLMVTIGIDSGIQKAYVKLLAKVFLASLRIGKCFIEPGKQLRNLGLELVSDPRMGRVGVHLLQTGSEMIAQGLGKLQASITKAVQEFADSLLPKISFSINISARIQEAALRAYKHYERAKGYIDKIESTINKLLKIEEGIEKIAKGSECEQLKYIEESF